MSINTTLFALEPGDVVSFNRSVEQSSGTPKLEVQKVSKFDGKPIVELDGDESRWQVDYRYGDATVTVREVDAEASGADEVETVEVYKEDSR